MNKTFTASLTNIIVFQFNPEMMTRNQSIYKKAHAESSASKKETHDVTGMLRNSKNMFI
ncbi:MAG: hypothetical protein Q8O17_04115 [Candidatus Methanoperedens sp.]|nr:hypothetical protein [Candidatus Methanoperedens sp.]